METKNNNTSFVKQALSWMRENTKWTILIILVVAAYPAAKGAEFVFHQNPDNCSVCHLMDSHVDSYYESSHMDQAHEAAEVLCTDCHDSSLSSNVRMVGNYLIGNYEDFDPSVAQDDSMCADCHALDEVVEVTSAYGEFDPHGAFHGLNMDCNFCHRSHEAQIDYCSYCHLNGGQIMVEEAAVIED